MALSNNLAPLLLAWALSVPGVTYAASEPSYASYEQAVPADVRQRCVGLAARTYQIPSKVIDTLLDQEGGKIGTISRNTNGSYDLGPLQINTVNLGLIHDKFPFLTWRHITYNPCINIMVGSWFLQKKIEGRNGNVWEGVGDYHSKTPSKRAVYLQRFMRLYAKRL